MTCRLLVLVSVVLAAACSRSDKTGARDAAPEASVATPEGSTAPDDVSARLPTSATTEPPPAAPAPRAGSTEARRRLIARVEEDPALVAASEPLRRHFGGDLPRRFAVQIAERPEGRGRALFVEDAASAEHGPIVVVVDAASKVLWLKERPAAGILPPVGRIAIAAGPHGRIAIAVCDPPTKRVALRLWDEDGSPFADFDAMDIEDCTAMSLLHWSGRGMLIVASRAGQTRAQLVTDDGAIRLGRGIDLGARTTSGSPASIFAASNDAFLLVQVARASGIAGAAPHLLAFRYDPRGAPLWAAPSDLGAAPRGRRDDRAVLAAASPGVTRVTLSPGLEADVTSNGTVVRTRRQGQ